MAYFPTPNTKQRKTLTCCGFQSNQEKGEAHPLAPYTHPLPLSPHSSHSAVVRRVSQHRPPTSGTEKGRCPRRLLRSASQNKPASLGGPHDLKDAGAGCPNDPRTFSWTSAEPGRTGRGGDRVRGRAGSAGKTTHPPANRAGGWENFLPNFPTRSRRGRGAVAPPGAGA